MRYMMIVKADDRSESGVLPTEQELADLMAFLVGQDQDPETDSELLR